MTTRNITKTLLKPDPGQARAQLKELAGSLAPQDRAAGQRLHAVAVELVRRGLEVTVVDYQDPSQELEIVPPQARHLGPVTIDRDASGTGCHLAWEQPNYDVHDVLTSIGMEDAVLTSVPSDQADLTSARVSVHGRIDGIYLMRDLVAAAAGYVHQEMRNSEHQALMLTLDGATVGRPRPPGETS